MGEFGLIDQITKDVKHYNDSTLKGIGDDAAVIKIGDLCQVVSTDLLTEGVHFDLAYAPLKHLGYKAVAVNLSDICAMNVIPKSDHGFVGDFQIVSLLKRWKNCIPE